LKRRSASPARPGNAALFELTDPAGVQFFFSPGAAVLFEATLSTFTTKRGEAPPPAARLAVGDAETWAPRKTGG
jgi:hypothetical protein